MKRSALLKERRMNSTPFGLNLLLRGSTSIRFTLIGIGSDTAQIDHLLSFLRPLHTFLISMFPRPLR